MRNFKHRNMGTADMTGLVHGGRMVRSRPGRGPSGVIRGAMIATLLAFSLANATPGTASTQLHPYGPTVLNSVGITRCTFVDHTRNVINYSTRPASVLSGARTLLTEIRYPTPLTGGARRDVAGARPLARSGGYPMIVFAHGYNVTPDRYGALLDAWARAGFVVVSPFFPDEKPSAVAAQHGVNTEGDLVNEPADIAFVTSAILQASAGSTTSCPIVNGLVQPTEIALAGHSDGATAVAMLAYDHGNDPQGINYTTLRTGIDYRAVIIMSGDENTSQPFANEIGRPDLIVIHSLFDQCNPIRNGVQLYDAVHQSNKWFFELRTAHHLPPFDGVDVPAFKAVAAVSVAFLQMSLQAVAAPVSLTAYGNQEPSVGRMYLGAPGPSLTSAPKLVESCGLT